MYEHPGGPSPKGGLDNPMIATGHGEESPIVGEAIQPPPALDEWKSKKFIRTATNQPPPALDERKPKTLLHIVTNKLKKKLGATASEVPAWQLYRE